MIKKGFSTPSYMLSKSTNKPFGYIKAFISLPNFEVKIKMHIDDRKKESNKNEYTIDGFSCFNLDIEELEIIKKATEMIANQSKTLISLSSRNQLKDEFYNYD